jgi:DNA recombination protein RmuC
VSLFNEITSLKSLNQQMSKDAINLTKALKGESKTRGNWGEVILQRVLEDSGLENGREYETQKSYRDQHGKRFQPDVVIHLPDNKHVVIDSKVSLNAYEKFCSSEISEEKEQALAEHLNSIRKHITDLQGKNYDELANVNSLDMVLMFVPIEPALMLATEKDENLFSDAFKSGIILVSPSTLNMNLQIIHNMWRYEYQNKNAREIAKRAGNMYDKFVGFIDALEDVGDKLENAQVAYQTAHKRLTSGKGNLVGRAETIHKLGLQTNKKLDKALVDKQSDDADTLEITDESK